MPGADIGVGWVNQTGGVFFQVDNLITVIKTEAKIICDI
jgi:hypothetical protein